MAIKFLSDEWASAVTAALNEHDGFKSAIAGTDLSLQFHVSDVPAGDDIAYYLSASGGSATLALGEMADTDVTVSNDYDTATAISKGDLNTQAAFMTGKLKVSGDLAKLMMNQAVVSQWAGAVSDLDVEY